MVKMLCLVPRRPAAPLRLAIITHAYRISGAVLVKDVVAAWKAKEGQDDEAGAPASATSVSKEDSRGMGMVVAAVVGLIAILVVMRRS